MFIRLLFVKVLYESKDWICRVEVFVKKISS